MRQSVRCGGGRYGGEVVAEAWAVKKELGRCPMWSCVPGPGWAGVLVGVSMCPPLFLYCIPSSTRIVQGLCCGVTGAGGAAARCAINACLSRLRRRYFLSCEFTWTCHAAQPRVFGW